MKTVTEKPNTELAYRVLDHIDAHPGQWDQGVYIGRSECGTVACFAGWACLLSGDKPDFRHKSSIGTDFLANGQAVSDRAQELLGADRWMGETTDYETDLFGQGNTREQLGRFVEEIFGPRPAVSA